MMYEPARISVIITCYNYGAYVKDAIESVLAQTYENREIIVINDGSTDQSEQMIFPYLSYPKVVYLKQNNRGHAIAKNTGIRLARGEFVAFLDADDRWNDKRKLEKQLRLFCDDRTGIVYSRQLFIDDAGTPFQPQPKPLAPYRGMVTRHLLIDNFVPFSSAMVRRRIFDRYGLLDETFPLSTDWELWLRLSVHCRFDYVDEPLICYRVGHPGQISKNTLMRHQFTDIILDKFISAYADKIPAKSIRDAKIYTFNNRGFYYRATSPRESLKYYWRSFKEKPFQVTAPKGLVLSALGGLWKRER